MSKNQYKPDTVSHPGETLAEWLDENDRDIFWLADATKLPYTDIKDLCEGIIDFSDLFIREIAIATWQLKKKECWQPVNGFGICDRRSINC